MLDLLYYHGANPLILNSNEQSSLHIASASNRLSIVQKLYKLTQTSLLEIKDNQGQTALSVTTHPDIIYELIAYGADISSLDNNHMNAIMIAVLIGQISIVNCLLSAINDKLLSIFDQVEKRNNRSIFLIAVQTGSIDMCSLLLTHSYIRWDTIDKQYMNAFHIAAQNNSYELIQFLCDYIRKSDQLISMKNHRYSVTTTTDFHIDNNHQTSSSNLHLYIDAQNQDGKTPLHLASEQGHRLCVEILLKYGADALLVNDLGQLPFHAAIQNGYSQCVDLLIKNSKKDMNEFQSILSRRQSPLITACQNGFVDIVKILISENIGINDNEEENPLEIAIKYRQIEVIHVLLEHPYTEYWLMSIRNSTKYDHQTPLRDMIRYIPECAQHAFDKLILKTNVFDFFGDKFERTVYKYKYIDDYFM
jgi:ankyrin repeat protein